MIARGPEFLTRAHAGGRGAPYQYQAAMAALHAAATTFEMTNWKAIILVYDSLDADSWDHWSPSIDRSRSRMRAGVKPGSWRWMRARVCAVPPS